ncbi:MAG: chemotaxis protein CheX [Candidatus Polarisedimenticolia bacterium]
MDDTAPRNADLGPALETAFREVIETMFGLAIEGPTRLPAARGMGMAGIIGLGGTSFRGILSIACTPEGARTLAGALVGGEEMLGDDPVMVSDSLGELANMLGGSVKRQIDATGGRIELSLPSVMDGEATLHGVGATGDAHLMWTVEGREVETSLIYSDTD